MDTGKDYIALNCQFQLAPPLHEHVQYTIRSLKYAVKNLMGLTHETWKFYGDNNLLANILSTSTESLLIDLFILTQLRISKAVEIAHQCKELHCSLPMVKIIAPSCKRAQNTAAETVTPKGNVNQKLYSDYSGTIYVVS